MKGGYINALDLALELPRVAREQPINVGQLRLLADVAGSTLGLDRYELLSIETHAKSTVDARIEYLCSKELIKPGNKSSYHERSKFIATPLGSQLHNALMNQRSAETYKNWLDTWIALPIEKREAPANVGILKVYALIHSTPDITTTELLGSTSFSKPTLISRLRWLERKDLIVKLPRYNAGGNGNPAYFRLTGYAQVSFPMLTSYS